MSDPNPQTRARRPSFASARKAARLATALAVCLACWTAVSSAAAEDEAAPPAAEPAKPEPVLFGAELPDAWDRARAAYSEGRFQDALDLYESLEKATASEPRLELWYNIGTTLARLGKDARAAFYFRRVLARDPLHSGALENLKFLGYQPIPQGSPGKLDALRPYADPVAKYLPPEAWLGASLGLWAVAILTSFAGRRKNRRGMARASLAFALMALVAAAPMAWTWHSRRAFGSGTVLEPVKARSGPGNAFPETYPLKAGQAVWLPIYRQSNGYAKVYLPNNDEGYILNDAVARH